MKQEDIAFFQAQQEAEHLAKHGPPPKTLEQKVADLRSELDGFTSRLKEDLLAELRAEVEKAIAQARSDSPT